VNLQRRYDASVPSISSVSSDWVLDNGRAVAFGPFVTVCHGMVLEKLRKCGLRKWTAIWLNVWAQRLVMSGAKSSWSQVM